MNKKLVITLRDETIIERAAERVVCSNDGLALTYSLYDDNDEKCGFIQVSTREFSSAVIDVEQRRERTDVTCCTWHRKANR